MSGLSSLATWWAMMIARDIDTCCALLRGEPVDPHRLHRDWLTRAHTYRLVRLDIVALDLLSNEADS